ncbi:hypothetical protein Hsw_0290 [Hymenobacter swuensis DY53]|uniref:Uncharacterized protein n=1 Tax=Hymenobacter swuensis DY53 TaxID=1227739 RepID=W8F237_9BACT|nr:hypothetical protein Hsw_0290 [Hymenobacter swuensis DY53]
MREGGNGQGGGQQQTQACFQSGKEEWNGRLRSRYGPPGCKDRPSRPELRTTTQPLAPLPFQYV